MSLGSIAILNVGTGDTKISFDGNNPMDKVRASRVIKDMLRRGYALMVEIERDGQKAFERVQEFREDKFEYVIADFDPVEAALADANQKAEDQLDRAIMHRQREQQHKQTGLDDGPALEDQDIGTSKDKETPTRKGKGSRGKYRRSVPADSSKAVAVGRSAGG